MQCIRPLDIFLFEYMIWNYVILYFIGIDVISKIAIKVEMDNDTHRLPKYKMVTVAPFDRHIVFYCILSFSVVIFSSSLLVFFCDGATVHFEECPDAIHV